MIRTSITITAVACATALMSTTALAQRATGALSDFVNEPDNQATALQAAAGNAIQATCTALGTEGNFSLQGEKLDLYLRCNEMVQTAAELQGSPNTTRSLRISGEELLGVVQQVSGEELHSQGTLSGRVTNGQFSNIAGRLNSLRLAAGAAGGAGFAHSDTQYPESGPPVHDDWTLSRANVRGGGASADATGSRVGWFLEGSFNTGERDATANEDGFDFDASSVTLGLDFQTGSGIIGVSAGLDYHEADFNVSPVVAGGEAEVEGLSGSLFGAWYLGSFYFDGILSLGTLDSDVTRRVVYQSNNPMCAPAPCPPQDRNLDGETDGDFITGGLTAGYDASMGNWEVSTTLSINYRDIDIDGYDEVDSQASGGLALRYAPQTIESFRSILGVAIDRQISRDFGVIIPQFRIEWHHEFQDDPLTVSAKYVVEDVMQMGSAPNDFTPNCISCFAFSTDEIDSDFGLVGIGASFVLANRLQLYGVYDGLVGLDNLTSHTYSFGVRGQF